MEIIDITVTLHEGMPSWPGSCGFKLTQVSNLAHGDQCNGTHLQIDSHLGTHIDAPWHFLQEGTTVEQLDLNKFVGQAYVADVGDVAAITALVLEKISIPAGVKRLLLRSRNSLLWAQQDNRFHKDFVALTADASQWVVDRNIELIGIDYLSIQQFDGPSTTHEVLLKAQVAVLEGLDLSNVLAGDYELICLPLKVKGADGAPARAILRR